MNRLPRSFGVGIALFGASAFGADAAPVVRAGQETADAAAVSRALKRIPPFQLAELGTTDDARRRAVVERFLVPELLAAAEARARGLDKQARLLDRMREAYASALEAELSRKSAEQTPVTEADVQQYFEQHRERFEVPRRIRIWRILVADEQLAKKIIAESRGVSGPAKWRNFARESSLDTATKFRDGDLGFVRPDGSTDTPQLRVDPALFAAVDKLADGELVAEPLRVPAGFAVIWRRGSVPAVARSVAQEAAAIRSVLTRQRLEASRRALLDELRKQRLKALEAQLLETLPDATFAPPPAAPRVLPPLPSGTAAPAGAETPKPGETGTR
jgi:peptidyl-prolyl cis-trans isomerase C